MPSWAIFFLINQTLTSSFSTIHLVEWIRERQLQDETRKNFVVFDASDIRGLVAMVCSLNYIRKRNSVHYYFTDSRKTCMLHAQFSTELSGYKYTTYISFTVAAIMLFMAMPSVTHLNASKLSKLGLKVIHVCKQAILPVFLRIILIVLGVPVVLNFCWMIWIHHSHHTSKTTDIATTQ